MKRFFLLVLFLVLIVSCSAKIDPYYVEYPFEMVNNSGVRVDLTFEANSSLPQKVVLQNGEILRWRTNSSVYAWPFDNVDTIAVVVRYDDTHIVKYGVGNGLTKSRCPGMINNYVERKLGDMIYQYRYTFTEKDYENSLNIK
ncbi:MAG: hypothetical protein RR363_01400 [Rikenellaceae bacterium]